MTGIHKILSAKKPMTLAGAPAGFLPWLAADLARASKGRAVFIAPDEAAMRHLQDAATYFAPELEVLAFPAWDCLPYDRVSPNPEIVAERVATLTRLLEPGSRPRVLVTTVNALVQKVPPRAVFAGSTMELKRGGRVQPERLAAFLEANGYNRTGTVMEPGEYALRGGIVDLFPPTSSLPIRVEFFGDEVDSIRQFNPLTQRSEGQANALIITPSCELPLWKHEGAYEQLCDIDTTNLR